MWEACWHCLPRRALSSRCSCLTDRILPDGRDHANLAPLPISARHIFTANLLAILIMAMVFAADVNAASVVLYPIVVVGNREAAGELARFAGVHACCVILASAFTFLACFSIMSALMALVPYRVFRRGSLYVRILIVVAMVALVATSFAVPKLVQDLPANPHVVLLPPVWYLALYQSLQGHATPELVRLSALAIRASDGARCGFSALRLKLPPMFHANFRVERRPAVPPPGSLWPSMRVTPRAAQAAIGCLRVRPEGPA